MFLPCVFLLSQFVIITELLQISHTDRKLDVITKMLKTVLQKQDEQAQLLKGTSRLMSIEGSTGTAAAAAVPESK